MTDQEMIECQEPSRQLERAIAITRRLRGPGGCPWDAEQTHESIISNLIEESYECIDAIRAQDKEHMREELGDVLMQVLFHAEITRESSGFDINDIACELANKLVRRHPHVFGKSSVDDSNAIINQWDNIKRQEQAIQEKPYLHNCGKGLPALMKAYKVGKKAAQVGFDWEKSEDAFAKVQEEVLEVEECLPLNHNAPEMEEELGDLLLSVVSLCRHRGVDPELALTRANNKFEQRFAFVEQSLKNQAISLKQASLDQMEEAWKQAKQSEKNSERNSTQR